MNTQQAQKFKILLLGDSCIDIYQYGSIERISPEAPVPVFKLLYEETRDGMSSNVKANLEMLGCDVTHLHGTTSVKTRLIDNHSKQHIVRLDVDKETKTLCFIPDLEGYDAIVISDYCKGFISYELVEQLRHRFKGPIFIDTKKHDLIKFQGCFVKINSSEFKEAISSVGNLIVTKGGEGATYKGKTYIGNKVTVRDVCGAGDTFLAALTYQYLNTNSIEEAIEFANKASSITVQKLGVYSPSFSEILT
jgi:D-beta-D-heptose 7-phosphate kinase/D-beta-D-heptose 1-phosphate adenosyltransferase